MVAVMRYIALAIMLMAFGAASRAETLDWAQELTQQMLEKKNCEVAYITRVRERESSDGALIEALVGCTDKRTYFVHREKGEDYFELVAAVQHEEDC